MSCLASGLLLLAACSTDKAYDDLDDIDLTIQVGSTGLTLPFGSTDRVLLTEVMDPETVDILDTVAGGDFVIQKEGNFDPTSVRVDPVTVTIVPTIAPAQFGFEATLPDGALKTAVEAYLAANPDKQNIERLSDIPGATGETSISAVKYDGLSFDNCDFSFAAGNVDEGLLALRSADLTTKREIRIELFITGLPDKQTEYNVELKNVLLHVPDYLKIEGEEAGLINVGALTLHKAAGSTLAATTISRYLTGIDYSVRPTGELTVRNRTLSDQSQISITADAAIDRSLTLTTSDLKVEEGIVKLYSPITIAPEVTIGDVTFGTIAGRFNPTISPIHTSVDLDLGDDMDFLKEDATIDLTNPVITLRMQNPCPVKVLADLQLTADNGAAISIADVDLTQPVITISRQAVASAAYNQVVPTLSTLLNPIPDHINVTVMPRTDSTTVYPFSLGQDYAISGDYDVSAPLTFNALEISYDETIENLFGDTDEDVQDVADKLPEGISGAVLSFTLENALPIALDIDLAATNRSGVEQSALITYSGMQTIPAGSLTAPATSQQRIEVGIPDVAAVRDLIVRVHGVAADGTTLNARQWVRFSEMKLTVKKVTLDLNDD
jgi:hypothetical protein